MGEGCVLSQKFGEADVDAEGDSVESKEALNGEWSRYGGLNLQVNV